MKKLKIMEIDEARKFASAKVRGRLLVRQWSQKYLASKIGISAQRLSRLIKHPETATCDTIWKVCKYFDYEPMPIVVRHGLK